MYVGMAAGVGKTYTMLEEGQDRRRDGEDVVIGWLETPRAGRDRRDGGGPGGRPPARGRAPRRAAARHGRRCGDRTRARDRPGRRARAHQRAGHGAGEALRGRPGAAARRHRRHLDRQRPAPREPQRPHPRADGRARPRDDPRPGAPRRRRGRARQPDARGVAGAPEGWEGVPPGSGRGGPAELLHHRQSRDPPRGGPPRGGRLGGRAREARHARAGRRPAGRPGPPRGAGDGDRAARARRAAPDPRGLEGRAAAGGRAGRRDAGGAPGRRRGPSARPRPEPGRHPRGALPPGRGGGSGGRGGEHGRGARRDPSGDGDPPRRGLPGRLRGDLLSTLLDRLEGIDILLLADRRAARPREER